MSPPESTADAIETVRRRLDFVESTIETVDSHLEDDADSRALVRVLGVLEQVTVDMEEIAADD